MIGKPVVIYGDSPYGHGLGGPNKDREALQCFLSNDHECEVRIYDHFQQLEEDLAYVSKLVKGGWVPFLVFRQCRYMEEQHLHAISFVREKISQTLPIVVIPEGWEKPFVPGEQHPNCFAFREHEPEFGNFIREKLREWVKPPDIFGVQNMKERDIVSRLLQNAYRMHNLNDSNEEMMLGAPDPNTQIVLQALRLKTIPAQFLKQEFDDTIPRRTQKFAPIEQTIYDEELQKILLLDDAGRLELDNAMLHAQNMYRHPDGGVMCQGVGQGENAWGFAIDWQTLMHVITERFGEHGLAKEYLRDQLQKLESLRNPGIQEREYFGDRMICGLILNNVGDFKTPLACLGPQSKSEEEQRRVADFLIHDRRFIPVTTEGYIFGRQPIKPEWQGPPLPPLSTEQLLELVRENNKKLEQTGADD